MVTESYKLFINSPEWSRIRWKKLSKSPECEWVTECPRYKTSGTPCTSRKMLHVHHLTYERFGGGELMEDLEVLCSYHHALTEIMKLDCVCGDAAYPKEDFAEDAWLEVTEGRKYVPHNEWLDCLSILKSSDVDHWCDYHEYILDKDD